MNLAELYSLSSGQRLDKIYTFEKFYSLPFSNEYIVIQPFSKPAKNYDYWEEVLSIIHPILEKSGIKVIQVGGKNEKPLNHCFHTQGTTSWGQLQYIISKAKLVLSVDSISAHLAGHYDIPFVNLISNNYSQCVKPYFGNKDKQINLEPDRINKFPSFSLDEGPNKQVNEILPEEVAKSVCKLLNLELDYPYKSLFIGKSYHNRLVESAVDCVVNTQQMGLPNILMRLDYNFNLPILMQQAQVSKISIITNKVLPTDLLQQLRPQVVELLYEITEVSDPKFCKTLQELKIPYRLYTKLPVEKLNPIKLDYLDFNIISQINTVAPEILKDKKIEELYIKSAKFIVSSKGLFSSYWAYKHSTPIPNFESSLQKLMDINIDSHLWQDLDYLLFLERV